MSLSPAKSMAKKISSLQIQGADAIGEAGLEALSLVVHTSSAKNVKELLDECKQAREILEEARSTEPFLSNVMSLALAKPILDQSVAKAKSSLLTNISLLQETHRRDEEYISDLICRKVPKHGTVFTHCHSSTVVRGLVKAWRAGSRFFVRNTETRPLFQGRKTARELATLGIPVDHFIDSAGFEALHGSDVAFFGCDAIYLDGAANKIGTRMYSTLCLELKIPVYFCTPSLKYDRRRSGKGHIIESRDLDEVWKGAPRKVRIENPAFDVTEPEKITGIISEFGVLSHTGFIQELRRKHPWLF